MLRLVKYLKPYILLILLSIALLFVQANCDLALPDYMSNIVNNGIQQGGVVDAVPSAIRQSEMNRLTLFMSADQKAEVLGNYTLVDQNSADYSTYLKDYPDLANEPVYVLNQIDQAKRDVLNPVLGKSFLIVSTIQQVVADPSKASELGSGLNFNLSQIPAGMDVFTLLSQLPAAQFSQMTAAIDQKFGSMDNSLIIQSAVGAVKDEYNALGVDTGKMQTNYIIQTGVIMLLLSLLSAACTVSVGLLAARTAAGVSRDLRKGVFEQVESFSNTEFDHFSTASLITRTTNDITQIQMVIVLMVRMVFYAPIMGVGGIIRALGKDSSMWWIIAVAVLVLISLVIVVFSLSLPKFRIIQKLIDRLNLVTRENLSGMMVIRAFNTQKFEEESFRRSQ